MRSTHLHLALAYLVLTIPLLAQDGAAAVQGSTVEAAVRATVTVTAATPDGASQGSGFIVGAEGIIATAAHVIRNASTASVELASGEIYEVQGVLTVDQQRDFALLRIAGFDLPTVELGNSDGIDIGSRVLAIGAPLGLQATVSDGLISAARLESGTRLLQISVPVSPGSSGGPVITEDGRVVAIVVGGVRGDGAENLNFALPINYLRGELSLACSSYLLMYV